MAFKESRKKGRGGRKEEKLGIRASHFQVLSPKSSFLPSLPPALFKRRQLTRLPLFDVEQGVVAFPFDVPIGVSDVGAVVVPVA